MTKISLQELKARSKELGWNPECIDLTRAAKSPTAAYDLFIARGSGPDFAQKCRYLAMIKRDYGKAAFERVVSELLVDAKCECFRLWAKPFAQTASRLYYLRDWLQAQKEDSLHLPSQDEYYVDIVEECITACDQFDQATKAHFAKLGGAVYLDEAKWFVESAKKEYHISGSCLEKTARVVKECLYASAWSYGVSETFVPMFGNEVVHYARQLRQQKESVTSTARL